jgi:hypothetical protein
MREIDYLIEDIVNWKIELEEVGGGGEFSGEDIDDLADELESMNKRDLLNRWRGSVGEWVASRDDVAREWERFEEENSDEASEYDNLVEWQLEKLLSGKRTDYGYVNNYEYRS